MANCSWGLGREAGATDKSGGSFWSTPAVCVHSESVLALKWVAGAFSQTLGHCPLLSMTLAHLKNYSWNWKVTASRLPGVSDCKEHELWVGDNFRTSPGSRKPLDNDSFSPPPSVNQVIVFYHYGLLLFLFCILPFGLRHILHSRGWRGSRMELTCWKPREKYIS